MTNHGHIISSIQTTDPNWKFMQTNYFRGTYGVFNGKGGNHYAQNRVFYMILVKVYFTYQNSLHFAKFRWS